MKTIKIEKTKFLENREYIEKENLPKYARMVKDELVVLYYELEPFEKDRQEYEKMGYDFKKIEWT